MPDDDTAYWDRVRAEAEQQQAAYETYVGSVIRNYTLTGNPYLRPEDVAAAEQTWREGER